VRVHRPAPPLRPPADARGAQRALCWRTCAGLCAAHAVQRRGVQLHAVCACVCVCAAARVSRVCKRAHIRVLCVTSCIIVCVRARTRFFNARCKP
jgi:hypothetical protein